MMMRCLARWRGFLDILSDGADNSISRSQSPVLQTPICTQINDGAGGLAKSPGEMAPIRSSQSDLAGQAMRVDVPPGLFCVSPRI